MFKSTDNFSTGDSRYEWYHSDSGIGNLVFGEKNIKTTTWTKISSIEKISNSTYLSNTWTIRNFQRDATNYSYCDSLILVDLTSTFNNGNIPNKDWCDKHIHYFDNSVTATWNGISMPIKSVDYNGMRTLFEVNDINKNDQLEYTFILSSTTTPSNIDFNDIVIQNSSVENMGNNRYKISGVMTVTEEMISGLPIRNFDYEKLRFFDINGVNDINLEIAHVINYNHFYK